MSEEPVPIARVIGGPRVVSVTADEEKRAVIASGIDELLAGQKTGGGGWSGPGGRSAGSGIALRKFDGVPTGAEGITALLPRGSSAPARRGPVGRGQTTQPSHGTRIPTLPVGRGAGRGTAPTTSDVPIRGPTVGLPPKRSMRSMTSNEGDDSPKRSPDSSIVTPPASRVPTHGRRAQKSAGSTNSIGGSGGGSGGDVVTPSVKPKDRASSAGTGRGGGRGDTGSSNAVQKPSRRVGGGGSGSGSGGGDIEESSPTKSTGYTNRPSAVLDPQKTGSPFGTVKGKTKFATYYNGGRIPVRIDHFGSGKNRIQWDVPIARANAAELIPVCAEGVRETVHPLSFVARQMFKEMLANPDAARQAVPSLTAITRSLRMALSDSDCFEAGMEAVTQLSNAVGAALDPHLSDLCSQLAKHSLEGKHRAAVWKTLQTLEENGGPDAYPAIKRKVPTYTTVRL